MSAEVVLSRKERTGGLAGFLKAASPHCLGAVQVDKDGNLSLEMGAETLAQLRTVPPLKGLNAGQTAGPSPSGGAPSTTALQSQESHRDQSLPGTPGTVELNAPASPNNFAGQDSGPLLHAHVASLAQMSGSASRLRAGRGFRSVSYLSRVFSRLASRP